MIEISRVDKSFQQQSVLSAIELAIQPGEFVTLVGPSGCGKSTLLRIIAGLESPDSGAVHIDGVNPSERPDVAFVFQDANLLPWRSVQRNIGLPLELKGQNTQQRSKPIAAAIRLVGLGERDARKLPSQLSGGMQMRVSLARALVTEPRVILMDEPFAALDDVLRQQLNEELLRLWREKSWTTVFVTHHVSEAVFLSQRVIVMGRDPGRFLEVIEVPFDYPRDLELRGTAEFAALTNHVSKTLRKAAQ